ncbi:beta 1-4 rhamnosyltransferase Cps2T [Gorillibacterium sp. sgz500922]|uniref:beta 1-4 rhamnosyltransferase Cps2T n=1 Tax=Gorillibacterium sp. sgz500922 TaxID=3446694 RepID=UPI003F66F183
MKHVFIIGSKGIPARYGGFETFVEQLTLKKRSAGIKYHVACLGKEDGEFEHNGARCFSVKVPEVGSAKAVLYDLMSLRRTLAYIRRHKPEEAAVYILACRIGPFFAYYKKRLDRLGVPVYVNPDGHEWKRSKWPKPVRAYWKLSERLMVKHADLLVCDSVGIEDYIRQDYARYRPRTQFISYGADLIPSPLASDAPKLTDWYREHGVEPGNYYLVVGRFVPENNYETMIREFMASDSPRQLVLITGVEANAFYERLKQATGFDRDPRIKFVGTVYDGELLAKLREEAYGYLHGHEVGGTNPSLLEALAATRLNLLLDVVFNREVGADGALYFSKQPGDLARVLHEADRLPTAVIESYGARAKNRIREAYSWPDIVSQYERLFLTEEPSTATAVRKEPAVASR